jgi:UDP-glucose 4-epimerase
VRAIVTGGAGFVGSHLVDALLERGDDVVVVDNLVTGKREWVKPAARFEELDIRAPQLVELFAEVRPDICFHLAAQADVSTSVERPVFDAEVNVVGTVRVLDAADGAQVVFASTGGAIYGECQRPAREDDPRHPLSPYGAGKLAAEGYLGMWNRLRGTGHIVLRFGNVYGPRQVATLEGGVVAIFFERLAAGDQTTIYGDGRQTRDFVYVGDVAQAALAAVGREGGVYNVGTGSETSVLELHDLCRRVAGFDQKPAFASARPGELQRSVLDVALAESELGWRAETSLEDGLRRTWNGLV